MGPAMSAVVILLALTIFPPHSDFSVFLRCKSSILSQIVHASAPMIWPINSVTFS